MEIAKNNSFSISIPFVILIIPGYIHHINCWLFVFRIFLDMKNILLHICLCIIFPFEYIKTIAIGQGNEYMTIFTCNKSHAIAEVLTLCHQNDGFTFPSKFSSALKIRESILLFQ